MRRKSSRDSFYIDSRRLAIVRDNPTDEESHTVDLDER